MVRGYMCVCLLHYSPHLIFILDILFYSGATLSDLSFVMVKNGQQGYVELGIIAESLQSVEGC